MSVLQGLALTECMHSWARKLRKAGIPVSEKLSPDTVINTRAKKRLGCCVYKQGVYTIEVSAMLLKEEIPPAENQLLQRTLIHELLHTCPGCGNHGSRWKQHAQKVQAVFGYTITRTAQVQEKEEVAVPAKYLLVCKNCNALLPRHRLTAPVKYPQRYRCGKCGGILQRLR